jgi:hypothetical protein
MEAMKMSTNFVPSTTSPLAPSELVYLNGESFAKKVMVGNVKLLHSGNSVSVAQLGQAIMAVAILASEQAGAIRLEVRQKKALLGLRTVNGLYVVPTDFAAAWPAYSLESMVRPLAEQLQADKESNEVTNILYSWLREDTASPWQSSIELLKEGMAARGILTKVEEKKLMVLKVTHYEIPASTTALVSQFSVEPYRQLLEMCENGRPEVWKLLDKQIKEAIRSRTEEADVDYDYD